MFADTSDTTAPNIFHYHLYCYRQLDGCTGVLNIHRLRPWCIFLSHGTLPPLSFELYICAEWQLI